MRAALTHLAVLLLPLSSLAAAPDTQSARWAQHAANTEIVRDQWGIAHVYGRSDADAVFGAMYAQAEDDFMRIEHNYLTSLGWLAQVDGEQALWSDLRQRLFVDPDELQRLYAQSPGWLQTLMTAWADGLNYYLARHPAQRPRLIRHFEPWMALSFTEGSIGGDIENIELEPLRRFYAPADTAMLRGEVSPSALARQLGGSNGFAIAPRRSATGHAMLWINPHTSYYFRSELEMVSEDGLQTYGAATWGQFFIYQGFNSHNGWMHTSYGGDAIDEYAESIVKRSGRVYYRYGTELRAMSVEHVRLRYQTPHGMAHRDFRVYRSHHGPIIRTEQDRWIAIKLFQDPVHALMQSYLRTKTRDYAGFRATQDLRTDTSNNTVYADGDGTIAYFHGNFIPRRDPHFDFTHPVDGSNPATEWQGPHSVDETITLLNPASGWIANTNNWPFTAAGESSPKEQDYPVYMWRKGENPRGVHANEVLKDFHDGTLDSLIAAGYDAHLTAFDLLLPPLITAYEALPNSDPRRARLQPAIEQLRAWDRRTDAESIPTALAIFWGQALIDARGAAARDAEEPVYDFLLTHLSDAERLNALDAAVATLQREFGPVQLPWGAINRYQRLSDDIVPRFDDAKPSLPVGFASSQWGALASFEPAKPRNTKKLYAAVGNSFVAAVEFGPHVTAKAIMSGGESGDPQSAHFSDQALMFSRGVFRDVWFERDAVLAHAERRYHPGDKPSGPVPL